MAGNFLQDALIYLGAALVCVPISKKLGIGSVLGYIIGGAVIGPYVLGFVGKEGEDVMHASEFGVVMMLFLVGLELNVKSFWNIRRLVVGLGGLQMFVTALVLMLIMTLAFSVDFFIAIALSLSFAMSSTAIVLQTLKEKGLDKSAAGTGSFAVLLFQDIAVIPIMAVLPFLGNGAELGADHHGLISHFPFFEQNPTITIFVAVALVYLFSRFLVPPFLHFISKVHMRELFTASALFLVIGVAWVMDEVGISPALGAFMAGVLLATSEFRHELESDIEPFKGILLGLFFTAVGSTINFGLIMEQPASLLGVVVLLMAVKAGVLYALARYFGLHHDQKLLFALLLCQVGEFAFVLLGSAMGLGILHREAFDFTMAVVTLSMVISPLLLFISDRFIMPRFGVKEFPAKAYDSLAVEEKKVIIVGFGHFGSTLGRFLRANGIRATILDTNSDRVALLRKMGFDVYYGDATRVDLLESAGAAKAHILISTIGDPEKNLELSDTLKKHFPHLKLFVRAVNRIDAYELFDHQVPHVYRESLHTSVYMGVDVLSALGHRRYTARRKADDFIKYDEEAMHRLAGERHDQKGYVASVRDEIAMQEKLLNADGKFADQAADHAWDKSVREGG
jgi:CPA2 family monovalent cation:H+ antiporter-2